MVEKTATSDKAVVSPVMESSRTCPWPRGSSRTISIVLGLGLVDKVLEFTKDTKLTVLRPLLEKIFSVPATSAPVECVFSHSGLIMRPHKARMSDRMLSDLVMLKCNKHI